ncbi:hypothetical protein [Amycolatopsis sp. GM8]|uniref:hypothetical protein n=1 Tax=Amycolatopsis sp. GM8 TaxID=2896530 RepID=UPI001F1BD970|nr:hypothetical protein [Amycolatopsis sp. GM8]
MIDGRADASLATPGLRTINFHRSHDRERMINFGMWSSFASNEKYRSGLATFQNDYFDLVDVVEDPSVERQEA